MPRVCTICAHKQRAAIEKAVVEGSPIRAIAIKYKIGKDSLNRHRDNCVKPALEQRVEAHGIKLADRLLDEMERLQADTLGILRASLTEVKDEKGVITDPVDRRTALRAVAEARRNLAMVARMVGRLDPRQDQDKNDGALVTWEEFTTIYRRRTEHA